MTKMIQGTRQGKMFVWKAQNAKNRKAFTVNGFFMGIVDASQKVQYFSNGEVDSRLFEFSGFAHKVVVTLIIAKTAAKKKAFGYTALVKIRGAGRVRAKRYGTGRQARAKYATILRQLNAAKSKTAAMGIIKRTTEKWV